MGLGSDVDDRRCGDRLGEAATEKAYGGLEAGPGLTGEDTLRGMRRGNGGERVAVNRMKDGADNRAVGVNHLD